MLQLTTAMSSAGWPPPLVKKHTSITYAFTTSWNLGDPNERAAFVRASDPDDGWKLFNVGTTTATKLLDLVQDKSSLFNWDMLLRVPIDGTGHIAANPKILRNGSKTIDAGFIDFLNLEMNYNVVTTKNYISLQVGTMEVILPSSLTLRIQITPNATSRLLIRTVLTKILAS